MRFEIYRDAEGVWRWRLRTASQRVVAISIESYRDRQACMDDLMLVKTSYSAPVVDVET